MSFTPKFVDLVRNSTSVQNMGNVVLGTAPAGFTGFAQACAVGDQFYYCIQGTDKPAEREVGKGTLQADGTIRRESLDGTALTKFTAGAKTISLIAAADWFGRIDAAVAASAVAPVATRSELGLAAVGAGAVRFLGEGERKGLFRFEPGNCEARVAADPMQGMAVAPSSAPTGVAGAWLRQSEGGVSVKWFGALGDGIANDGPAFVAAIAWLKALAVNPTSNGYYKASQRLLVPPGDYRMGTTTLDISHTLAIEGEGMGFNGPASATTLRWADGATGIRLQAHNTSGATTVDVAAHTSASGTGLRNLDLVGGFGGTEGEFHGLHAKVRFSAENCRFSNFAGSGVHVDATSMSGDPVAAPEGNANLFRLSGCAMLGNRDGLFTKGGDANAGIILACDFSYNRRWGVNENSFLANSYVACHSDGNGLSSTLSAVVSHGGNRYAVRDGQEAWASANAPSGAASDNQGWYFISDGAPNLAIGLPAYATGMALRAGGAYRTTNPNAPVTLTGCYSESGQGPAQLCHPTIVLGGLHGAGIEGSGVHLRNNGGNFVVDALATNSVASKNYTLWHDAIPLGAALRFNNRNHFAYSYANSDQYENEAFEITTPGSNQGMDPHYMWLPRGLYAGPPGATYKVLGSVRPAAIADDASGAGNQGTVNAILSALRAQGLIAA